MLVPGGSRAKIRFSCCVQVWNPTFPHPLGYWNHFCSLPLPPPHPGPSSSRVTRQLPSGNVRVLSTKQPPRLWAWGWTVTGSGFLSSSFLGHQAGHMFPFLSTTHHGPNAPVGPHPPDYVLYAASHLSQLCPSPKRELSPSPSTATQTQVATLISYEVSGAQDSKVSLCPTSPSRLMKLEQTVLLAPLTVALGPCLWSVGGG